MNEAEWNGNEKPFRMQELEQESRDKHIKMPDSALFIGDSGLLRSSQ
jgi:hypothetical protein